MLFMTSGHDRTTTSSDLNCLADKPEKLTATFHKDQISKNNDNKG